MEYSVLCVTASVQAASVASRSSGWITSIQPCPSYSARACPVKAVQLGCGGTNSPDGEVVQTMEAVVSIRVRNRSSLSRRRRSARLL